MIFEWILIAWLIKKGAESISEQVRRGPHLVSLTREEYDRLKENTKWLPSS